MEQPGFNQLPLYWLDDNDQPVEWEEYYICTSCAFFDCVSTCATPADAKRMVSPPACPIDYAAWLGISNQDRDTIARQVLRKDDPLTIRWCKRAMAQQAERNKFLTGLGNRSDPPTTG